jgi:Fungal Zn(2)-Cys(6) binuclear cluster domain
MGDPSPHTPQPNHIPNSPPLRRNGQQAACEPCRKAKLRCDHALPVCSRCKKRRTPTQCVVLATPITKSPLPTTVPSKASSQTLSQVSNPAFGVEIRVGPRHDSKWSSFESSGFLGPTSFSATVQHDSLGDEPKIASDANAEMDVEKAEQLRIGVQVLMRLPEEEACQVLMEWYLDNVVVVGVHKLSRRMTLKALWLAYGHLLRGQRNAVELEVIARDVLRNGRVSLKQVDDPLEWIASFSGANTRWEVIGLLFVAFAYALLSLPENELSLILREKGRDRNALVAEMKSCIEACVELCRNSLNNLVCNLLYFNMLLETILSGDSSKSTKEHQKSPSTPSKRKRSAPAFSGSIKKCPYSREDLRLWVIGTTPVHSPSISAMRPWCTVARTWNERFRA